MSLFLEATRPVLFEADDEDYPYFGVGSSVLLSTERNFYLATAYHVMENQKESANSLRVFPNEASRASIPFQALVKITPDPDDTDFADLYILQIAMDVFAQSGDEPLTAQRVEDGFMNPSALGGGTELIIVGFPEVGRSVDYESFKIRYQRSIFVARYNGPAASEHCHELTLRADHGLETLNALSGSPVYRMVTVGNFILPKVVGILIRGAASSGLGTFVSSEVLRAAIMQSEAKT
ncbi:MAG: hypothetical protein ACSHXK_12645 [Oceanococcus sp.]